MSKIWKKGEEITEEKLNDSGFGFHVVPQATPNMTLRVNAGVAVVNGTVVKYAGGNTPSFTAPASNPRIDIITIDSAGTIAITQGAENASPTAPSYPSDKIVLSEVFVRVGATALEGESTGSNSYIYRDSRAISNPIQLIASSTGVSDAGKGVKTDADGRLDRSFLLKGLKFGGDGSDGALTISSGTTTIDAANAAVLIKQYSSISITGTGALNFINPHANGTVVVLKSQGDVTITSSATAAIDLRGMGASNGNNPNGVLFGGSMFATNSSGTVGTKGVRPVYPDFYLASAAALLRGIRAILPGACGGNGGGGSWGSAGAGGLGGGALYLEAGGALNFTGTVNSSGQDGGNMTGSGSGRGSGSGGGGSAGMVVMLYNILTSIAGTVNSFGGKGGDSQISGSASGTSGRGGPGAASQAADGGDGGNSNGFATGAQGSLGSGSGGNSGPAGSGSGTGTAAGTTMPAFISKNYWFA